MVLYPPQIEGTLPAFYKGKTMAIPFVMNKTVSWNQIDGFAIKIKNIQNNEIVATLHTLKRIDTATVISSYNKELQCAYFDTSKIDKFTIGTSYKVQMCYIKTNRSEETGKIIGEKPTEYGYYSTVGVIKCSAEPDVSIDGLQGSYLHSDTRSYMGVYNQKDKDISEKVYSYNFTVYDEDGHILETSGEKLHNHENDEKVYESIDFFNMTKALKINKIYTIVYTITTANGIVKSSPKYRITQQSTIPPEVEADLVATMNEENGYVNLQLIGKKDSDNIEKTGVGTFLICRASSEDNYGSWSEVDRFALFGERPSSHNWKDFTVQHGFTYIYSLQQYNKEYQVYSDRMLSNEIIANFEHSFLYDGERQLKIKYNPKVTSFKETILEQKTNTLGGKYPFFFRNGNVRYKEFPISGLISYLSDEEELFLTNDDLLLEDLNGLTRKHTLKEGIKSSDYDYFNNMLDANMAYKLQEEYKKREDINSQENQIARKKDRTTNLTDYNIVAERIFKMKVLDFLNDGKPKLFRSPGEGNFIVRLMNSSLSPDDKLSRMIHTFSTTATEIDECNYQKLNEYNLISAGEPDIKQLRWKTVNIRDLINTTIDKLEGNETLPELISIGGENNIYSIQCLDMIPGDSIKILYNAPDEGEQTIHIGVTGAYFIEFDIPPQRIQISSRSRQGQITYSYYGNALHHFDTYRYIKMQDIPVKQFRENTGNQDIREYFNLDDIKFKVLKYYFLNFTQDYLYTLGLQSELQDLETRYQDKTKYPYTSVDYENERKIIIDKYQDPNNTLFKIWIDGKEIDISETQHYTLIKPTHIPEIRLGTGVCLDASIQYREIEYDVEEDVKMVKEAKDEYLIAHNKVQKLIKASQSDGKDEYLFDKDREPEIQNKGHKEKLIELINNRKIAYNNFIEQLERALKEKEVLAE